VSAPDALGERLSRAAAVSLTTALASDRCGFLFDFDGTLSPISSDPAAAALAPGVIEALSALRRVAGTVSIVSARPVSFLRERFPIEGIALYGLYGLERGDPDGRTVLDPAAQPWVPVVAELVQRATEELTGSGILVEDKGVSVALHYRNAPERGNEIQDWARRAADRAGLRIQGGRMVVELKPPVDRDKGSIVAERVADLDCAWYLGDDVGDLAAFAALGREGSSRPYFLPVRVAVANPESGGPLADAADFTVDSPTGVVDLLTEIVAGWLSIN
jgi:trehalose 6-phosphate phosphatase